MTREEMLKTLIEIKEICTRHEDCEGCPLGGKKGIFLEGAPEDWRIPVEGQEFLNICKKGGDA